MSNYMNEPMRQSEWATFCLRLHVGLFHDKDAPSDCKPCTDQTCAGRFYYEDHPDDWDDLTHEQIIEWARGWQDDPRRLVQPTEGDPPQER